MTKCFRHKFTFFGTIFYPKKVPGPECRPGVPKCFSMFSEKSLKLGRGVSISKCAFKSYHVWEDFDNGIFIYVHLGTENHFQPNQMGKSRIGAFQQLLHYKIGAFQQLLHYKNVSADKTSVVSADKTSVVSADETFAAAPVGEMLGGMPWEMSADTMTQQMSCLLTQQMSCLQTQQMSCLQTQECRNAACGSRGAFSPAAPRQPPRDQTLQVRGTRPTP